jgi:hypothetical protein
MVQTLLLWQESCFLCRLFVFDSSAHHSCVARRDMISSFVSSSFGSVVRSFVLTDLCLNNTGHNDSIGQSHLEVLWSILLSKKSSGIIAPMKVFEGDVLRGLTTKTEKSFIIGLSMMKSKRGDPNRLSGLVIVVESKACCQLELNKLRCRFDNQRCGCRRHEVTTA